MIVEVPVIDIIVIDEKGYTVKGYKNAVPVIDLKMCGNYEWQQMCLESRLQHPERYADEDAEENAAKIAYLRKWLEEHKPQEFSAS